MKSLETVWRLVGSRSRRARNVALAGSRAATGERCRRRPLRERVAREKLKASSAFVGPRPASCRLKVMLEPEQDFRRCKHLDVSASDEMPVATYRDTADRAIRTRSVVNDPRRKSKRSGFARAEGRHDCATGAPWAMKVAVCLGNGARPWRAGQSSHPRSVRFGDIEILFSEIGSLSSGTCCFLHSAIPARKAMGGGIAEAAVRAMMWSNDRQVQHHFHASRLCLIDGLRFLREMMPERRV
ncbi:hypothetical protein ACVINW_003565 [Bradyrhizobium sp. USDA 4461]